MLRLRDLREDRDLKQDFVATLIGTNQQYYSEYERGVREMPPSRLCILADYYNTSIDYILGRTNEIKPYPKTKQ